MPRGTHLSSEIKYLIYYLVKFKHKSAEYIFRVLFQSDESFITRKHLVKLVNRIGTMSSEEEILAYLGCPAKRGGRVPVLSINEQQALIDLLQVRRHSCIKDLWREFATEYYALEADAPTYQTIVNAVHQSEFTRKIIETTHRLRDEGERYVGRMTVYQ